MTKLSPTRSRLALICAGAMLTASIASSAMASAANNASAGNDRTTDVQYSRTLLPDGRHDGRAQPLGFLLLDGRDHAHGAKPAPLRP